MDVRFIQPFRRWLLFLRHIVPRPFQDKYLDWLYPDDCVITFKGDE